jgi:hypothetical protein
MHFILFCFDYHHLPLTCLHTMMQSVLVGCESSMLAELCLHLGCNLLTFVAIKFAAQSQSQELLSLTSPSLETSSLAGVYVLLTLGGVLCCSLLRAGSRISSWIGFSLASQLCFVVQLLFGTSLAAIHTTASGLFVQLLALHVATWNWENDLFHGIAVAAFHVRLIRTSLEPRSLIDIVLIAALFLAMHLIKWITNRSSKLCQQTNSFFYYLQMVVLGGLEIFIWSSFFSWEWLSPVTLSCLCLATCVHRCRLGLSPPEALFLFGFHQLASSMLMKILLSEDNGDSDVSGDVVLVSRNTVLAVSYVGILGIIGIGK